MDNAIEKLIEIFKKFPTVGQRTASRFVYYLARQPKEKVKEISDAILELRDSVKLCRFCFNPFEAVAGQESENLLCPICRDQKRNRGILCVVEKEADLSSIENTKKYNGLYFILGGTLLMMRKEDFGNLRITEFKNRILKNNFSEIIIALNPTPEGTSTSVLLEKIIKSSDPPLNAKISHLARGIPVGGELEYADQETLESAFEGRK